MSGARAATPDPRGTDRGGLPVAPARAGYPVAALEREADVPALRRSSRDHGQRLLTRPSRRPALGTGRPARAGERAAVAAAHPALAALLDDVTIHDDAQAAAHLHDEGARGLATADAVALRPGLPDRDAVLAHELAHVAQQRAGEEVDARDDAPPGRVGDRPPDEDYTLADGRAPEDGHVLFPHGSAELSADARARLSQLVAGAVHPVTVDVHGYASSEGEETFNRNLSAHRAVAVAQALRALLPDGSVVRVFARGQTAAFGQPRSPNRRAGVDVHHEPVDALAAAPAGARPPRLFGPLDLSSLGLSGLPRPGVPTGAWRLDPDRPTPGLDVGAVTRAFSLHGARLSLGDLGALEAQYGFWYPRLAPHLGHELTATVLNIGVGNAVGSYLSREHATATDVFEREIDVQHQVQGAWQTPILTIDVLDVLRKRGVIQ